MVTNNENRVKRNSPNMIDLGGFTDDELVGTTDFLVCSIPDNQPLSRRIGRCTNMTDLALVNCSSIPSEIFDCTMLSNFCLYSHGNDDNDCRIDLPEGNLLQNLNVFNIKGGGNWNADKIILWLATCSPNLCNLCFYDLTRDTANQFMTSLQNNEAFLDVFQNKLEIVSFHNCNFNEDDAREIIFDIKPLYPRLGSIELRNNNIEGLKTFGTAVRETPPANNNPLLPSNLRCLLLKGNPCFGNLNYPKSPDSVVMIDLLKYHPWLCQIGSNTDETITCSSLINYWLMMNRSGLRYLVVDIHGGTRLSGILPHVMNHAQNPTAVFTFLREGPIFRTQY